MSSPPPALSRVHTVTGSPPSPYAISGPPRGQRPTAAADRHKGWDSLAHRWRCGTNVERPGNGGGTAGVHGPDVPTGDRGPGRRSPCPRESTGRACRRPCARTPSSPRLPPESVPPAPRWHRRAAWGRRRAVRHNGWIRPPGTGSRRTSGSGVRRSGQGHSARRRAGSAGGPPLVRTATVAVQRDPSRADSRLRGRSSRQPISPSALIARKRSTAGRPVIPIATGRQPPSEEPPPGPVRDRTAVIEDPNVMGMRNPKGIRSRLRRAEPGEIPRQLKYGARPYGHARIGTDRRFPSPNPRGACGFGNDRPRLSDRTWIRAACGTHHDRGVNAFLGILEEGVPVLKRGGEIRPGTVVAAGECPCEACAVTGHRRESQTDGLPGCRSGPVCRKHPGTPVA